MAFARSTADEAPSANGESVGEWPQTQLDLEPAVSLRMTWWVRVGIVAASLAVLAASAVGFALLGRAISERPDQVGYTIAVARHAEELRSALPTGDTASVLSAAQVAGIDARLLQLKRLVADDEAQRSRVDHLQQGLQKIGTAEPVSLQALQSLNTQIDDIVGAAQIDLRDHERRFEGRLMAGAASLAGLAAAVTLLQWMLSGHGQRVARRALRIAQIHSDDQATIERLNVDLERRVDQRTAALMQQRAALRLRSDCSLLLIAAEERTTDHVIDDWRALVLSATSADHVEVDVLPRAPGSDDKVRHVEPDTCVVALAHEMGELRVRGASASDQQSPLQVVLFDLAADLGVWLDARHQRELRRQAEAVTERMGTQLAALFDEAPMAMALFDTELRFVRVNAALAALSQIEVASIAGKRFTDVYSEDGIRFVLPLLRQVLSSGQPVLARKLTLRFAAQGESPGRLLMSMIPLHGKDHQVFGVATMAVDVTEIETSRERLVTLSRQLLQVEDAERSALARELHDDVGQQLAAMKISLRMFQKTTPSLTDAPLLIDALQVLDECIAQVRHRAMSLRPALLDEMGVEAALRWHAKRQSARYSVPVDVDARLGGLTPRADWAGNVYRIAQEALRNALQHGRPTQVWISLSREDGAVVLSIRDNGHGISPDRARRAGPSGIGLMSMRERVELLGGTFELKSVDPQGTEVLGRWPESQVIKSEPTTDSVRGALQETTR